MMMHSKQKHAKKKSGKGMIPAGYADGGMVKPMKPKAYADGGMVCGKTSSLHGKNMKK